jgi:hypothetical protein
MPSRGIGGEGGIRILQEEAGSTEEQGVSSTAMVPAAPSDPLAKDAESRGPLGASRIEDPSESGEVESTAVVQLRALLAAAEGLLQAGLVGEGLAVLRRARALLQPPGEARRALGS